MHKNAQFWGDKRYYSLDYYLKETFGEKVYRLSLNGGMTCPNRDGSLNTGGCIFCSAGGSGDFASSPLLPIPEQIRCAKERIAKKTGCQKFIAYFQAYTNTYAPTEYLRRIFGEALAAPEIVALSVATRCDCLPPEVLALLSELNQVKPVWVELGLQTANDNIRDTLHSGFSFAQYEAAVTKLRERKITIVTHLIIGLPGESKSDTTASVLRTISLPCDGVKLQLLHILKGTRLGALYEAAPFSVYTLEEYCDYVAELIRLLPPDLVIHRLTGDGPRNLLLAPLWSTDKKRVLNTIQKNLREKNIFQGCAYPLQ